MEPVAKALITIRDQRLFRDKYATFEITCGIIGGGMSEEFGGLGKSDQCTKLVPNGMRSQPRSGRRVRRNECTVMELKLILEAILFSSEKPLSPKELRVTAGRCPRTWRPGQAIQKHQKRAPSSRLWRNCERSTKPRNAATVWSASLAHGSSSANLSLRLGSSRCLVPRRVRRGFPCPHWRPSPSSPIASR